MITGAYTLLITPFDGRMDLDEKGLRKLVRRQVESGIHGIAPLGVTGESPALTEEEIAALWENVRSDINLVEAEHRICIEKVFLLNWIDSAPQPEWPAEATSEFFVIEQEAVWWQDQSCSLSFFKAAGKLSGLGAASAVTEKVSYYAAKWSYLVLAMVLAAILLLAGGGWWYQQQAALLENDVQALRKQIADVQMPAPVKYNPDVYPSVLAFIKELARYRRMPSFRQVVNDMSGASFGDLKLERLKIDYADKAIQVEVYGRIKAPFDKAHRGYQRFLKIAKSKGYQVRDSRFDTEINTSHILIKLIRSIA